MPRQYTRKPSTTQPHPVIWIVVADAGQARIFQAQQNDGVLTEVADLVNSPARRQAHDAQSDRAGSAPTGQQGGGGTFETPDSYPEHVADAFAKRVCEKLSEARNEGAIARLYLLAGPAFLGRLRAHMDEPTRRLIAEERASDLVHRKPEEIRKTLPKQL